MKRYILACCMVIPALGLAAPAFADDSKGQPSLEQMMAEYMKLAQPGPHHERMKSLVGSWRIVSKMWLGPGDPQVAEGSSTVTSMLGGRFISEEVKGTFMGMPMEGIGLTGYDNMKKAYIGTWIDSMGTGIIVTEGTSDDSGKTITWKGSYPDPISGGEVSRKMIHKIVDDNRRVMEMYENREGQEVKSLEVVYTRQ